MLSEKSISILSANIDKRLSKDSSIKCILIVNDAASVQGEIKANAIVEFVRDCMSSNAANYDNACSIVKAAKGKVITSFLSDIRKHAANMHLVLVYNKLTNTAVSVKSFLDFQAFALKVSANANPDKRDVQIVRKGESYKAKGERKQSEYVSPFAVKANVRKPREMKAKEVPANETINA